MWPPRGYWLFQFEHDRARYRIGDAQPTAEIFQQMPECIERADHLRPGGSHRIHAVPFTDDAISMIARFDDVDVFQAGPVPRYLFVCVEEFLVVAGFDAETDGVEGCHRSAP